MHPQSGQPSSGNQGGGAGAAGGNQGGPKKYGNPYNAPEQNMGDLEARDWDEFEKRYWLD